MDNKIATCLNTLSKITIFRFSDVILSDISTNIMITFVNLIIKDLVVDNHDKENKWETLCNVCEFMDGTSPETFKYLSQCLGINLYYRDFEGDTYLHKSCYNIPNVDVARCLVSIGFDVNSTNYFEIIPIINAVWYNHLEIIKILLDAGSFVNYNYGRGYSYDYPIIDAVQSNNLELTKLLLKYGADPNLETEYNISAIK